MKILRYFANGFTLMVDAYVHPRDYVRTEYGFEKDNMNLAEDVRNFGSDMRRVIRGKHVERSYERSGY